MNDDFKKFDVEVRKATQKRKAKKNSYDLKDFYRDYIKGLDRESQYFISEKQYGDIIRLTNQMIQERLLDGRQVVFPLNLGSLQIECYTNHIRLVDGKIKTSYPIDWSKTLQLWYEDERCRNDKVFVRGDDRMQYHIRYRRGRYKFRNRRYLMFMPSRPFKKNVNNKIKTEGLDALPLFTYGTTE